MIKMTVLYDHPSDVEAFNSAYLEGHVSIIRTLPGLDHFDVALSLPGAGGNPAEYHLIAELYFADSATLGAALSSEQGEALRADTANFVGTKSTVVLSEIVSN